MTPDGDTPLGIEKSAFKQLKVVLRPARKHKFRFEYTPINYTAQTTLQTTFVFNGQRYAIGHVVENGHDLFVSSGLGTSIIPIRFRVPPEVSVLILRARS